MSKIKWQNPIGHLHVHQSQEPARWAWICSEKGISQNCTHVCFLLNYLNLPGSLLVYHFLLHHDKQWARLSPVFSFITPQAEPHRFPHTGHFEVTLFPLFKQCIYMSQKKNTFYSGLQENSEISERQEFELPDCSNNYFRTCPVSSDAFLLLASCLGGKVGNKS